MSTKNLLWMDLEMTGLDDQTDQILEVAAVVTDIELQAKEEFHRIVFQPKEVLDGMNDWCKKTHGASGLTAACATGTPLTQVESELLDFIKRHFRSNERIVIAGNSIGNDRRFIDRYMPAFAKKLHYRMIDVSSYKEIYRDRYKLGFKKANAHRATGDIHESIRELGFYLSFVKVSEQDQAANPVDEKKE